MVGPLYHTHPKSSHPELAALQTQIDQLVRLQDMIFTLVYENPHHLDPKKNSHITPQLQACLEMIRGPQIRFNTDPPYHGLNLNHLETVQLATLLLNNIPAPEADQKAQGAPEAKAEDAVSEVSLHEPARPAASFTPAQLTELSLVIQELVANNHNEAGLKSLRDRILVLQQGDHTQPQDIVTCFLGTARERLSKTREANFPEAQKAAGASASEHEPTEQLGAAKRSGMEKFSTAMSALTRSKNTQAVYEAAVALMDSPSPENIKGIKKAIDAYIADKARVETWRKRIQESKSETAKEILLPEIDRAIQNGTVLSEIVHRDEAIRSGQKLTAIQLQRFIASAKNKEHAYTGLDQIVIAIAAGNRKEIQAAWDKTAKALEEGPVAGTYHAAESGMPAQKDVSDLLTVMLNKNSHSLLMLATQQGNHDAIKFLIEKSNAHPGTTNGISTLEALLKGDGKTSVFHCVHDVKTFKTLLKQAPASMVYHLINQARSLDGYTPLELAIQNNNVELVTALLRAGADPHQISKVEGRKGQSIWESLRDSLTPPVVDQMSLAASRPDLTNPAGRPTPHPATTATIATVVFSGSATPERETIELPELATALRKALYDYADALQGRRDWLPGSRTVEERLKAQESVQIGLKLLGQLSYLDEKSHEAVTKPYEAFLVAEAIKALDAASGKSGLRADSLIVLLWKRVKEIQTGTAMPTTFPNESIGVSEHDKRKMRAVLKDILTVIGAYTPELEKTAPGASAETTSGSSDASDGGLNSAHDPKFGPQNDL
ncbi:MAG: hypothetical protein EBX40_05435 [Gammaproteobacteria bacterium]|nr:hypothetical protein [Gammaproteobacteria bacterium]